MTMKLQHYALTLCIICLPACSWVKPTSESNEVTLVKSFNVKTCRNLGSTVATVTHKVGIITFSDEVVMEELITLAKNRAAKMGGDSVVAQPPVVDGSMGFEIYKCGE